MDELFGVPIERYAVVLGIVFIVFAAVLLFILFRNPILVKMAFRQVFRRPARGILVVVGLMLATAIIMSAFTTGDSMTYSVKSSVIQSLRTMDELIRVDEDSDLWQSQAVPDDFSDEIFTAIASELDPDPDVDGLLPVVTETVAVVNLESQQFEANALITGLDPARASTFDEVLDTDGAPVDISSLGDDELYLDREGAEELGAEAGDVLQLFLGPQSFREMTVKAVMDGWFFNSGQYQVVMAVSLERAQELLDKEGRLSYILVSNAGDDEEGVELTESVVGRHGDLPALVNNGLEMHDVKQEGIDFANEWGNLFLSFFTVFGLFSIGVGLLLIFLIFSMLAAERKAELGMARAIGMKRGHLIRMFIAEGAIYGLGSSVVGVLVGIVLGYILVKATAGAIGQDVTSEFSLSTHVQLVSVLVAFFLGTVVTLITVAFASWRISRINIVRAIRDIPEPRQSRATKKALAAGIALIVIGLLIMVSGYNTANAVWFWLGPSLAVLGAAIVLRYFGVARRWALSGAGILLVIWWLLPPSVGRAIRDDWSSDFTVFFVTGTMLVLGAVLVTVNNTDFVLGLVSRTVGRIKGFAPIIKSSIAYPLRFGFRTGISVAMFAVVIYSVTVMSVVIEGFNELLGDEDRLGGGYQVMAFSLNETNPVTDLTAAIEANPDLDFVSRVDGKPSVGILRNIWEAEARLTDGVGDGFSDTILTGVDDDFADSNLYQIMLSAPEYLEDGDVDTRKLWRDVKEKPGLAVVNSFLVPSRSDFQFDVDAERFTLAGVEDLFQENDYIDPVQIEVRDLRSNTTVELTVVGVFDDFASQGLLPVAVYTSTRLLDAQLPRDVDPNQFFFNVEPGTEDAAQKIEAEFFTNGMETLDIKEVIDGLQGSNRAFTNLLLAFMSLGLVVGIAALGVVSARAVVERRHQIGVLRAIGYSRGMVQLSFLLESSFIALLGIGLGLVLGLLTSINVISSIRYEESDIRLVVPWAQVLLIVVVAYVLSLLTTFLPARSAGRIAPAEALRYE